MRSTRRRLLTQRRLQRELRSLQWPSVQRQALSLSLFCELASLPECRDDLPKHHCGERVSDHPVTIGILPTAIAERLCDNRECESSYNRARHISPPYLFVPVMECRLSDSGLAADFRSRRSYLSLAQGKRNLCIREFDSLHRIFLLVQRALKMESSSFEWHSFGDAS